MIEKLTRNAKIAHFNLSFAINQNVWWLNIPVDHLEFGVEIVESINYGYRDLQTQKKEGNEKEIVGKQNQILQRTFPRISSDITRLFLNTFG